MRLFALSVLAAAILASNADAATIVWTNTSGGNWNTAANWNSGAGPVPGAGDVASITTDGTYTVTLDVNPSIGGFVLGASSGTQTLSGNNRTITIDSPSTVNPNGVLLLTTSTVAGTGALDNQGLVTSRGSCAINVTLTTQVGSTLRAEGSTSGTGTLTVLNGFTNSGTIELTNSSLNQAATLAVTNGALVNAAGGVISALVGSTGGARTLNVQLDNHGSLTLARPLTMSRGSSTHVNESDGTIDASAADLTITLGGSSPSFTNNGTLTIGAAQTVSINNGAYVHGAAIAGTGTLSLANLTATLNVDLTNATIALAVSNCVLNGPASLVNAATKTQVLTTDTVNAATNNQGLLICRGATTLAGALTAATGSTLRSEGGASGTSTLTVANGFTNNGTIELTNNFLNQSASLNVSAGILVNAAGSAINSLVGSGGGARTLSAQLDNHGAVTIAQPLGINRASSTHVNESDGSIDASAADLTITLGGAAASFTNNGTLTIGAARTVSINSGTYVHGAAIAGTGTLALANLTATLNVDLTNASITLTITNCTINGPGQLVNAATKTLGLTSCTVNAATNNQGLLICRAATTFAGALTADTGSTLRSEGSGSGTSTLTVTNGFTNNGTIELTNNFTGQAASLNVSNGTLVNAPGQAINVLAGLGGGVRTLSAQLDNHGSLTLGMPLTMNRSSSQHVNESDGSIDATAADLTITQGGASASFTNNGTLTIGATHTVSVNNGSYVHSAVLAGAGTLALANLTATLNTDLTDASVALTITNSTINGPAQLVNAPLKTLVLQSTTVNAVTINQGLLIGRASNTLAGALTAASGSTLRSEGSGAGTGSLTVTNGFTNNGTIELTNSFVNQAAILNVTNGSLVNAAGQAINVLAGLGGGVRTLNAQLDNHGTLTVGMPLTVGRAASAHVNESDGTIDATAADLTINQSGALPSFTNNGAMAIGAGRTVTVNNGAYVHAATLSGGGTLSLAGVTATLNTNLSSAAVDLVLSTCVVNGPAQLVNVASKTLLLTSSTVNAATNNQGTLICRAANNLVGALTPASGSTLRPEGSGSGTGALTVANGFTNNGTIEITNSFINQSASLTVTAGSLVNAAGGAINVLAGLTGGIRTLNAQLDNHGTISVGFPLTINRGSSTHVNESDGAIDIAGGNLTLSQSGTTPSFTNAGRFTVGTGRTATINGGTLTNSTTGILGGSGTFNVTGTTFTNAGHVAPGASPGILTIIGVDPELASSNLDIELGGRTAGTEYDRLVVTGALTLAGALNVSLINGFTPVAGDQFRVVNCASLTGLPSSTTGLDLGGGLQLEPRYDSTGVSLVVVGETWVRLTPISAKPTPRDSHSAVYDPTTNAMIVFGGRGDSGPLGDVQVLANANGQGGPAAWTELATQGGPPAARANHTAVYDAGNNRMIVYGGDDETGATPAMFGDVWVLTNANGAGGAPTWIDLAPGGGPPPLRTQHAAIYDPSTNTMTVFGGNPIAGDCSGGMNDVWTLSNANGLGGPATWTELTPTGGPPIGRRSSNAAYDAANNQMLVFGGDQDCATSSNEVWALSNANGQGGAPVWSLLTPGGLTPPAWSLHSGAYDPGLNRLTAFGGLIGGVPSDTVLTLSNANGIGSPFAWADLSPVGYQPAARSLHSAASDEVTHRMIVFAGLGDSGRLDDTWLLEETQGRVVGVEPPPGPAPTAVLITGFSHPLSPNPMVASTQFAISLARAQRIELSIYDVSGRLVTRLARGVLEAGAHPFEWNGTRDDGARVGAGIYLVSFRGEDVTETRRVCVVH